MTSTTNAEDRDGPRREMPAPGLRARDAGPFDEFWQTNVHRLAGYLYACSGGDDRFTDDATQETMIILERRWESRLRPVRYIADPVAYAHMVGRRLLRRYLTRDSRCAPLDDYTANRIPALGGSLEEWVTTNADVLAMLRALSSRQREAVVLRIMFGYSIHDTAKIMKVRPDTIKTHITRAMETLRKHGRVQ